VGVMGSEVTKATFATKHLEQDLGRLLQVGGCSRQCLLVGHCSSAGVETLCCSRACKACGAVNLAASFRTDALLWLCCFMLLLLALELLSTWRHPPH
jgi:hypothetical protein